MKSIFFFPVLLLPLSLFGHGGDNGPSALEDEFSKLSHVHLPIVYSTTHGLSFSNSVLKHDHHHEHEGEDLHGDHTGLSFEVHPEITVGHDRIRRLVNLEQARPSDLRLEAAGEGPYLLLENKKWDLGLGLAGHSHLPNPLYVAGIAISYLKGKNYYSLRVLEHANEERESLELPLNQDALENWRVGDQLSYASYGSFFFGLHGGIEPIVHIGGGYIHTGSYRVKLHLEEEDHLNVEILTTETDSIMLESGALVLSGEMNKGKGHARSVSYTFDLKNPQVFQALNYLFAGRLDLTNHEVLHSGGSIRMQSSLMNSFASVSGSFGLPVLYFNGAGRGIYRTQGVIEEMDHHDDHLHDHSSEVYSTASIQENFTRGTLSKHKWLNRSLFSTVMTGEHSLISTVFSWSFSKDQMKLKQLRKKLSKLASIFSEERLAQFEFPLKDLGYVKADFAINLNGGDVLFLLNTKEMRGIKDKALQNLEEDFRVYGHQAFCQFRSYLNCFARYKSFIENKHQKVQKLTESMNLAYKNKEMNALPDKLNKIVSLIFGSKYLTQAFVSKRRVSLQMNFEGEKIKRHSFEF